MQQFFNSISNIVNQVSSVSSINSIQAKGYQVKMNSTSPKHFNYIEKTDNNSSTFLNYLKNSISQTNNAIVEAELLQQQLVMDPDSTNIDDVTIAAKEAEIALNLTKTVINKLITGYKELINIR